MFAWRHIIKLQTVVNISAAFKGFPYLQICAHKMGNVEIVKWAMLKGQVLKSVTYIHNINSHYKLATFSRRQKPMCLLGENFQYGLLGEKGCNFIMILSSGEPQPIFSNVAFGPSALRQHWKILASAHHLIMLHCCSVCFWQYCLTLLLTHQHWDNSFKCSGRCKYFPIHNCNIRLPEWLSPCNNIPSMQVQPL